MSDSNEYGVGRTSNASWHGRRESEDEYEEKRHVADSSCCVHRHKISSTLMVTSLISQALPLIIVVLIFTGSAWLSWALERNFRLSTRDWDRLYALVGQKILRPRNWFVCSLALGFSVGELLMMMHAAWMMAHNRMPSRRYSRAYFWVHVAGALLKLYLLGHVIDGGVRIITEHVSGPENFTKGYTKGT